jgi:hypothetical protein
VAADFRVHTADKRTCGVNDGQLALVCLVVDLLPDTVGAEHRDTAVGNVG